MVDIMIDQDAIQAHFTEGIENSNNHDYIPIVLQQELMRNPGNNGNDPSVDPHPSWPPNIPPERPPKPPSMRRSIQQEPTNIRRQDENTKILQSPESAQETSRLKEDLSKLQSIDVYQMQEGQEEHNTQSSVHDHIPLPLNAGNMNTPKHPRKITAEDIKSAVMGQKKIAKGPDKSPSIARKSISPSLIVHGPSAASLVPPERVHSSSHFPSDEGVQSIPIHDASPRSGAKRHKNREKSGSEQPSMKEVEDKDIPVQDAGRSLAVSSNIPNQTPEKPPVITAEGSAERSKEALKENYKEPVTSTSFPSNPVFLALHNDQPGNQITAAKNRNSDDPNGESKHEFSKTHYVMDSCNKEDDTASNIILDDGTTLQPIDVYQMRENSNGYIKIVIQDQMRDLDRIRAEVASREQARMLSPESLRPEGGLAPSVALIKPHSTHSPNVQPSSPLVNRGRSPSSLDLRASFERWDRILEQMRLELNKKAMNVGIKKADQNGGVLRYPSRNFRDPPFRSPHARDLSPLELPNQEASSRSPSSYRSSALRTPFPKSGRDNTSSDLSPPPIPVTPIPTPPPGISLGPQIPRAVLFRPPKNDFGDVRRRKNTEVTHTLTPSISFPNLNTLSSSSFRYETMNTLLSKKTVDQSIGTDRNWKNSGSGKATEPIYWAPVTVQMLKDDKPTVSFYGNPLRMLHRTMKGALSIPGLAPFDQNKELPRPTGKRIRWSLVTFGLITLFCVCAAIAAAFIVSALQDETEVVFVVDTGILHNSTSNYTLRASHVISAVLPLFYHIENWRFGYATFHGNVTHCTRFMVYRRTVNQNNKLLDDVHAINKTNQTAALQSILDQFSDKDDRKIWMVVFVADKSVYRNETNYWTDMKTVTPLLSQRQRIVPVGDINTYSDIIDFTLPVAEIAKQLASKINPPLAGFVYHGFTWI